MGKESIAPADAPPQVAVKPGKTGPFYSRHPWVLDASVARVIGQPADGDVVDLVTTQGQFIARGVFNSQSRIRVRLYSWRSNQNLDDAFWRQRIENALALRRSLQYDEPDGACRAVFSEADGLSGLVVDRYADCLVVQVTARAMHVRLPLVVQTLAECLAPRGIVVRTDSSVAKAEGLVAEESLAWGSLPDEPVVIRQRGVAFRVDVRAGQKTGFYLDQRENRAAVARYVRGLRVLDVCSYSGGFALSASVLGRAREVVAVDASDKAIALLEANAQLNGVSNVRCLTGDCFDLLPELAARNEPFDAVILDPPRFAGSRRHLEQALHAYHRLNRLGVNLVKPGGFLATCSCSGHVTREAFRDMLQGVALRTGREIQILEQRGAAPDHPTHVSCPETDYLKCFICRVL